MCVCVYQFFISYNLARGGSIYTSLNDVLFRCFDTIEFYCKGGTYGMKYGNADANFPAPYDEGYGVRQVWMQLSRNFNHLN